MFNSLRKKILTGFFAITLVISNPVVNNDEVTVDVAIDGLSNPNYLQGMFTKSTSSPSYFGYTQNGYGDWYKYNGSPTESEITSTFFLFTPQEASWSGKLKIKNDPADPDYVGPGSYVLRVKRYTGGSSSAAQTSNDLIVDLTYTLPTLSPTSTPVATLTPTPTFLPSPATPIPVPTVFKTATPTIKPTATLNEDRVISGQNVSDGLENVAVLGLRDTMATKEPADSSVALDKKFPLFPVILIAVGVFLVAGALFFLIKNNVKKIS